MLKIYIWLKVEYGIDFFLFKLLIVLVNRYQNQSIFEYVGLFVNKKYFERSVYDLNLGKVSFFFGLFQLIIGCVVILDLEYLQVCLLIEFFFV